MTPHDKAIEAAIGPRMPGDDDFGRNLQRRDAVEIIAAYHAALSPDGEVVEIRKRHERDAKLRALLAIANGEEGQHVAGSVTAKVAVEAMKLAIRAFAQASSEGGGK